MQIYKNEGNVLSVFEGGLEDIAGAVWVDIENPDEAIVGAINQEFNLNIPHLEQIRGGATLPRFEVEDVVHIISPRLIVEQDGKYWTDEVIFVLTDDVVITLRSDEPECFRLFRENVAQGEVKSAPNAPKVFFGLMTKLSVDYTVKVEEMGVALSAISHEVFTEDLDGQNAKLHKDQIDRISRVEDLNSKVMNSLMGLSLIGDYLSNLPHDQFEADRKRFEANIESLIECGNFISDRIDFVLNAVMSVINLEQNRVMNVFSVFTVIFTIPTVFAGLWGMNFINMPVLQWQWGYLMALIIIVLSGLVPYWFVKKMGWL